VNLILFRLCRFIPLAAVVVTVALPPLRADNFDPAADKGKSKDPTVRLEDFEVTEPRVSAETMAPTESRLDALQPMSIINLQTIQNSVAPSADYAMIANLAPSVTNFSSNGPGLNESKPTLRGFSDGMYNVTFDGIPFGDGNDFTHHTTSYFPAKLIGRETIDRGPGTASTPQSHAAVACPSSWTHMLKKIRISARPGPVQTSRNAPSSADGTAQARIRASSRRSSTTKGLSCGSTSPAGSSAAARASAFA